MKKRLVSLVLISCCVLMVACGEKAPESNPAEGSTAQDEQASQGQEQLGNEQQGQSQQGQSQQAESPGKMPEKLVEIRFEFEDESMDNEAGELYFYSSYTKPVVTIKGNDAATAKINKFFENDEEQFENQVDDYEWEARDFYESTQGQSYYMWCKDVYTNRADASVISFVQSDETYLGGAHGSYFLTGLTFDTSTGELLDLKDLSDDGDAFYQMLKEEIIEQSKVYPEQEAFYNPPGSQEFAATIDDVLASDSWYFTKSGLVVVANQYFIGPYVAGKFTFEIPYDSLDGLKEQYIYTGSYEKEIPYEEDFSIDLNGDGSADKIHTTVTKDDYYMINGVVFDINDGSASVKIDNNYTGEDKAYLENPMEKYSVVDLDQSDSYMEIAVGDYGMNDYNITYFFRYDGDKLSYIGSIPNVLESMDVELYGNGIVAGTMRMEMVETVRANVYYQLKDGRISLVEQEWYEPDYSYFPEEYLSHDVLQDVTVYKENSLQSEKVVLKAGEEDVRFLATDNVEWVKLKTEDGQIYYLHMVQPILIDSDGQEIYATDVFKNILLAG